jgi:hypothetical protein
MMHRAKLEEALRASRAVIPHRPLDNNYIIGGGVLAILRAAAEAHLAALPKTKMVEVWHVEWALNDQPMLHLHLSEADARASAKFIAGEEHRTCVRVTGPHQQEVPA